MLLKPLTIKRVRMVHDYYWEVMQKFERLNGETISVYAHGFSRSDALKQFSIEVCEAEHDRPYDLLEDLGNALMDFCIPFERAIKALRDKYGRFMPDDELMRDLWELPARHGVEGGRKRAATGKKVKGRFVKGN